MQLVTLCVLATVALTLAKQNYLAEKPDFLTSCHRTDSNFKSCFAKNFEGTFKYWKDGVPGLKSLGSLDPLHVKRIAISQNDNNSLLQMDVALTDIKVIGISDTEISKINFDLAKGTVAAKFRVPRVRLESDYSVKGRLLQLQLNGNGKATLDIDDFKMDIQMILKLRDEHGYTFTDVEKLKLKITDIAKIHINLENLFQGNKELESSTNDIINQSWREFYGVLGPAIEKALHSIMFERLRKVFEYVPAQYFVEDIPTAAAYYG